MTTILPSPSRITSPTQSAPPTKDSTMSDDTFRKELQSLLNRHSKENGSNTPDFILADYLIDCLNAWDTALTYRTKWYQPESPVSPKAGASP